MCSVGNPTDMDFEEGIKGKNYICRICNEKFKTVGRRPMCPSCQSEDVEEA